jgi:hypothetical protein
MNPSFRLDPRELDHPAQSGIAPENLTIFGPLLGLLGDKGAEVGGRTVPAFVRRLPPMAAYYANPRDCIFPSECDEPAAAIRGTDAMARERRWINPA